MFFDVYSRLVVGRLGAKRRRLAKVGGGALFQCEKKYHALGVKSLLMPSGTARRRHLVSGVKMI